MDVADTPGTFEVPGVSLTCVVSTAHPCSGSAVASAGDGSLDRGADALQGRQLVRSGVVHQVLAHRRGVAGRRGDPAQRLAATLMALAAPRCAARGGPVLIRPRVSAS
ncbi:hypothetical protein GCM10027586_08550 [Kineococcus gypseus]